jgi:integrase
LLNDPGLKEFMEFCRVDLRLAPRTVHGHVWEIARFLRAVDKDPATITREDVRSYLSGFLDKAPATYANIVKSLRVFFRDYIGRDAVVATFKLPRREFQPKHIPSREDLQRFYQALPSIKERALFLFYATTGLRKNEALSLLKEDIDLEKRIVIPRKTESRTKRTWVSFFNDETRDVLKEYLESRTDNNPRLFKMHRDDHMIFRTARAETGIQITPEVLREFFACEMGRLNMPDRYVDAFCGRVPHSVLARHYTDFSPERLKEIYDRAGLSVLDEQRS